MVGIVTGGYAPVWERVCEAVYIVVAGSKIVGDTVEKFDPDTPARNIGTAFAVSKDGVFLTATHVIKEIKRLAEGRDFEILLTSLPGYGKKRRDFVVKEIIKEWSKSKEDITLLKADVKEEIPFIPVRTSGPLEAPGRPVATFGYPLQKHIRTPDGEIIIECVQRTCQGVVAAIPKINNFPTYEVDAIFNPGNSGGPLVSIINGDVVGVVTGTRGSASISLAKVLTTIGEELEKLGVTSSKSNNNASQ